MISTPLLRNACVLFDVAYANGVAVAEVIDRVV